MPLRSVFPTALPTAIRALRIAAACCGVLLAMLALVAPGAFGQAGQAGQSRAPTPSVLTGTGEQMRVIAAVCDEWKQTRKNNFRGSKGTSADIRDYNFEVTLDAATYKVTLRPRKPVVTRVAAPGGVILQNESSTFFYEVRRSDFRIVGVSAIL